MIIYKSRREIDLMLHAGQVLVKIFERVPELLKPGRTTKEVDSVIHEWMVEAGCTPSFLGYRGFTGVACISIDEEVVHGIPGPRKLREGDMVTVDLGVIWKGYQADAARTFGVGPLSAEKQTLVTATAKALDLGLEQVVSGGKLSRIGGAIQKYSEGLGYSVVEDFVGHGIGRDLHEEPQVPNYVSKGVLRRDIVLKKGLVIAVEPMLNVGTHRVEVLEDGWTVVTKDGKLSAHFEDTIAVTADGPLVLTRPVN